jgi:hypothetical protein
MKPPLQPSDMLKRVLRVARFDGMSVLVIAGAFALISGAMGDTSGAVFGALIAAAGAIELRGVSLLRSSRRQGIFWLVGSQLYLMSIVLGYVSYRIFNLAKDPLLRAVTKAMATTGMDLDEMVDLPQLLRLGYLAVAAVTIVYQGGMIVYYLRRRAVVTAAIEGDDTP